MAGVTWTGDLELHGRGGRDVGFGRCAPAPVAAVLAVLAGAETAGRAVGDGLTARDGAVLCVLAAVTTLPVALAEPVGSATVVTAGALVSLAPFHSLTVAGAVGVLLTLHRLARLGPQWLAAALAVAFLLPASIGDPPTATRLLAVLLAGLAPLAAWWGAAQRARGEVRAGSAAQAELAGTVSEHIARGERARIASELHDVVAHHISMVAVQAETARLTTPGLPPDGAQRLLAIGATARDALTEMRRLLGVLREDTGGGPAERRPQPGLLQLGELLDDVREASGTGARLILKGTPEPLDPGVELAAYRIVQEALTNARRHAPGAAVDVELHYADDGLHLRVRDNGPGPPPSTGENGRGGGGHGLVGMRERAASVGGQFHAGPAAGGGFLVTARLPGREEER